MACEDTPWWARLRGDDDSDCDWREVAEWDRQEEAALAAECDADDAAWDAAQGFGEKVR
jgi:hypothetical protein